MERLQLVLEFRVRDLVNVLVRRAGLDPETAERFVSAAGADLLESWRWQSSEIDVAHLPTWSNVQRLLGGIHANAIAFDLGMPPSDVWTGLRTFVPQVLLMANGPSRSATDLPTSRPNRRTGGTNHGSSGTDLPGVSRLHQPRRLERVDLRL